ncbi:hypothetical protein QQF64_012967 [Cirrhinus molitorella]|uniref:Uncharacterized protein n=1 Tax=Cirrhinus molitorella TaxID=172907 RepID=A0ABR3LPR3_9TELE
MRFGISTPCQNLSFTSAIPTQWRWEYFFISILQTNQTLANGPHPYPQDSRPFGLYAEDLFSAGQWLGLGEGTLVHLFVMGLDEPINWEEHGI